MSRMFEIKQQSLERELARYGQGPAMAVLGSAQTADEWRALVEFRTGDVGEGARRRRNDRRSRGVRHPLPGAVSVAGAASDGDRYRAATAADFPSELFAPPARCASGIPPRA